MLDDIRDQSRERIHDAFSIPVTLRSLDGSVEISVDGNDQPIKARLHRDLKKPFGDLDREGFALAIEFMNQVIFDSEQWVPVRNYVIDFGRGRLFRIETIIPPNGDRFVKCEVVDSKT